MENLIQSEQVDKAIELYKNWHDKKWYDLKSLEDEEECSNAWNKAYDYIESLQIGSIKQQFAHDVIISSVRLGLSNSQIKAIFTVAGLM